MEENKKKEESKVTKSDQAKKLKVNNNSIVILRHRGATDLNELEDMYSGKFGCKVIILESNLDYVGKIDG